MGRTKEADRRSLQQKAGVLQLPLASRHLDRFEAADWSCKVASKVGQYLYNLGYMQIQCALHDEYELSKVGTW